MNLVANKMKKILVIVPFPMSEDNLKSRRDQLKSVELSTELQFEFRSTKAAPKNYISQSDMVLADIGILEAGLNAKKEGFSAVCIDTMSDSGVDALRSCLDIPVIGPGQTSMLCAMMMGNKFSIITMWKSWFHLYDKNIKNLGIKDKVASIRSINVKPDNQSLLAGKEEEIFPLLLKAAQTAVENDGADVIILGSTTMHQSHAYLTKNLNVPVINPGPLTYKMAETMIDAGLAHSKNAYPGSPVPKYDLFGAMMDAARKADR